jgi:RNA polymerase sigma-70 factor (ECF subfamily)
MDVSDRAEVEAELRRRAEAGDLEGVITRAIRAYGPELLGFLGGLARDPVDTDEIFSAVCERLWRGLARFRWDSSFRVWAYAVARNEFYYSRRAVSKARRGVPISEVPSIHQAIAEVRSSTSIYRRSDVKDEFARLREELEPDDRMILGLRVERGLEWNEIARVLGADGDAVKREAAALRKRFERLKKRIRELARERKIAT